MNRTIVIAEAGVNHNGDLELAKQLIDVASRAGADFVKFQTFKADALVTKIAPLAVYQRENLGDSSARSQYELLKKLELDLEAHQILIAHCKKQNIRFLSAPFDLDSIDLLDKLGLDTLKIPSGEITNYPYLKKIGSKGKKLILSTGMSDLKEVGEALDVLKKFGTPSADIAVLHCNTQYPTPFEDVHLNVMKVLSREFNVRIGYSDHTLGIEVPIAAVALGASVIEKHITLDRNMDGPDHKASLEPGELTEMIRCIRNIEKALGSDIKKASPSETRNIEIARKSIHLARPLKAGHLLQEDDFVIKRPGHGISPMKIVELIGKTVKRDLEKDHLLSLEDLI